MKFRRSYWKNNLRAASGECSQNSTAVFGEKMHWLEEKLANTRKKLATAGGFTENLQREAEEINSVR